MVILSLFDGIACARVVLEKIGIKIKEAKKKVLEFKRKYGIEYEIADY